MQYISSVENDLDLFYLNNETLNNLDSNSVRLDLLKEVVQLITCQDAFDMNYYEPWKEIYEFPHMQIPIFIRFHSNIRNGVCFSIRTYQAMTRKEGVVKKFVKPEEYNKDGLPCFSIQKIKNLMQDLENKNLVFYNKERIKLEQSQTIYQLKREFSNILGHNYFNLTYVNNGDTNSKFHITFHDVDENDVRFIVQMLKLARL